MTRPAFRAGCGLLALLASAASRGEDIAPFRLTGIDGYADLRYVQDVQLTDQPGGASPKLRQAQSGWRSEVFVMSHSYVYHPNFLTLDIGGGPILHTESFAVDDSETKSRGALYDFTARASFLRDKPYRGALFYDHLNPTVSVAPGQVLTQQNERYGFDFSWLAPATPVPVQLGFTRSHNQGRGSERVVDDRSDQFNLTASRAYGALGSTQVQYQSSQQASTSGSQNLAIQATTASNQALNVDTRLQFGPDRQYDLTNLININSQKYAIAGGSLPDLRDARFLLDLRARNSDQLRSYGYFNFGHSAQGELVSTSRSGTAGLTYTPNKQLETGFSLRADDTETRQFATRDRGLDGSVRYEQPLPLGTLQASYGLRYDQRSQQALAGPAGVIGERLTLSGTGYVTIGHTHVLAGSIVVSNATRSQTFVEGIDYLLTVVGFETRIQRLIGGRILDGDQVLLDYSYDVGGSYAYDQLDQTMNLDWAVSRYLNVYYRYFDSAPRLASGTPSFPLNDIHDSTYGIRVDMPLKLGIDVTAGGSLEREDRRETVAPYRRTAADAYLQTDEPVFGIGNFRLSGRRLRIDYGIPAQNVDLVGYDLRFWTRQYFGVEFAAATGFERDSGGLLPRERQDSSLSAQWRERKFTLTTSLVHSRETQGGIGRSRTLFQFMARRDF